MISRPELYEELLGHMRRLEESKKDIQVCREQ
jgi:hypothetical protein